MEVILLKDVDKVGLKGDVVNVTRGYARNFLLPRRLAEEATRARVAELRKREQQRARHEAQTHEQARDIASALEQTVLRFDVKAGPTGSLFGSVTATDIVEQLWAEKKIRVDRRKVGTDPIRRIGRHTIPIELFRDVTVELQAHVVPEGGELPPDEELEAMEAKERAEAEAAAPQAPAEELVFIDDELDAHEAVIEPGDAGSAGGTGDAGESPADTLEPAATEQQQ